MAEFTENKIGSGNKPIIESALKLAQRGFNIFPLIANSKKPAYSQFSEIATTDTERIKKWWGANPNFNIGIFTGRFNGGKEALIGIDVDVKGDKNGNLALDELSKEGLNFPKTFEQETPTGGRHLIYKNSEPVRQGVNVLGPGLDIRSHGGYLVGAGSIISGKKYFAFDVNVAQIPPKVLEKFKKPNEKAKDVFSNKADLDRAMQRAVEYLASAPTALQGEGGDHLTFQVACHLKDFGLDEMTCFHMLYANWNLRCEPPWSMEELKNKVHNAYRYGQEPPGVLAPENVFEKVETSKKLDPIEEMNKEFSFVIIGSKACVIFNNEEDFRAVNIESFHQYTLPRTMAFGKKDVVPVSRVWISDPRRKTYKGVRFSPGKEVSPEFLNLWKGFKVKPNSIPLPLGKKAVEDFLGHAKENICDNDEKLFTWLITFFAHLIQKPWEKPSVAVVFRGKKGVGKNAFIERIGHLLGRHHVLASNPRYLSSNFNSYLENCLLLTLDEAFWSGDKRSEGVLKDLITGRNHMIERKGFEPYVAKSFNRVVVIGNEDWVVPASQDERRFAVFEVGDKRKNDIEFFKSISDGMSNHGGYGYLIHYLSTFDLSRASIDLAPATKGLSEQKIATLSPLNEWIFDCLKDGHFTDSDKVGENGFFCEKEKMRESYRRFCREKGSSKWIESRHAFDKKLKALFPDLKGTRRRVEGERTQLFLFPPMKECRKLWDIYIGHETEWDDFEDFGEEGPPLFRE